MRWLVYNAQLEAAANKSVICVKCSDEMPSLVSTWEKLLWNYLDNLAKLDKYSKVQEVFSRLGICTATNCGLGDKFFRRNRSSWTSSYLLEPMIPFHLFLCLRLDHKGWRMAIDQIHCLISLVLNGIFAVPTAFSCCVSEWIAAWRVMRLSDVQGFL